ncbi:hypothetical protein ACIBJC_12230 [Streptomyces sp. NPDC050509]|uniref:hypothetical protein n=1 Tax=Streptomyces sp. NPDC050509 TaxID=3365620 RepID=UPI0037A301B3
MLDQALAQIPDAHRRAGRIAVQTGHAGQLGGLGAVTQRPVLVQGGTPEAVWHGAERGGPAR